MRTIIAISMLAVSAACASVPERTTLIADTFDVPVQSCEAGGGEQLAQYSVGAGAHVTVFLHGIPSSSYMWRNVLAPLAQDERAVAIDLPGYGRSDLPVNGDYSYASLYQRLETCLDSIPDQKFTLVVTDLGSLLGIDYAMRHPERIDGLVLIEAVFMPAEPWHDQLTSFQKLMFGMMRSNSLARHMIVDTRTMYTMLADIGVARDLSDVERGAYLAPYEDRERRRVVLEGPGPTKMPRHGVSRAPGDLADIMNQNAARLAAWNGPILILTAAPGFIVQQPAIDYASKAFRNVEIVDVGRGKHFLAEDQPEAIAAAIVEWRRRVHTENQ